MKPLVFEAAAIVLLLVFVSPSARASEAAHFTAKVDGLHVSLEDASSSTNGAAIAWAWDLGDGTNATGAIVSHDYAAYSTTYRVVERVEFLHNDSIAGGGAWTSWLNASADVTTGQKPWGVCGLVIAAPIGILGLVAAAVRARARRRL